MWQYIGLLNIILGAVVLVWILWKNPQFSIKKQPLSYLASYKRTGILFKILLFIFSLNQTIFVMVVAKNLLQDPELTICLFSIGGLALIIASIFSLKDHDKIHNYTARISLLFVWLGMVVLACKLLPIFYGLGIFLLVTAIAIGPIYFLRNKFVGGLFEIPLILIISSWNVVLSIYLLS